MIVEKARIALEKLRRTNYKQSPDFGLDDITEELIAIISNECKSTVITENGNRRYESDIVRDNIDSIVRQLITNGSYIPKDVMSKIVNIYNNRIIGVNSDIAIYKGIEEAEDGSIKTKATTGNSIINIHTLEPSVLEQINEKIYNGYARQLVLKKTKEFPKQNRLSVFKEKLLHGRENKDSLAKLYTKILKENTKYSDEIIKNTVQYNLDYMYDERFEKEIIKSMNEGSNLVSLEEQKSKNGLNNLYMAVSAEVGDMMNLLPDLNQISKDISQIYSDVEAQLVAYSTDITKLTPQQIENKIKEINSTSLNDKKFIGNDGYRTVKVGITGKEVNLLNKNFVKYAVGRLSNDIYDLVQNGNTMGKDEYLKKAVALQYRFIRIHPFPNSNGRTSRALLNMMIIPKGIIANFSKEDRNNFLKETNKTNVVMDEKGYLSEIAFDSEKLDEIENSTDIPLYEYIKNNCIIDYEDKGKDTLRR